MKQYETIKMTSAECVEMALKGKDYCTPEVWRIVEKRLRTMGSYCTPKPPRMETKVDHLCPTCDEKLKYCHDYCPNCGQAIEW